MKKKEIKNGIKELETEVERLKKQLTTNTITVFDLDIETLENLLEVWERSEGYFTGKDFPSGTVNAKGLIERMKKNQ